MFDLYLVREGSTEHIGSSLPSVDRAQIEAERHFGGPLNWTRAKGNPNHHWRGLPPNPGDYHPTFLIKPEEGPVTQQPEAQDVQAQDIQTFIQNEIQKAVGGLAQAKPQSFEEVLAEVDPADSEAALAMLDFLLKTGRLGRVGVLDDGGGYLFMYREPKGSTKQGYTPGATRGDRIVDKAIDEQRAAGAVVAKRGLCTYCLSAVVQVGDEVLTDNNEQSESCSGSATGKHQMA